jgi:hypothetical protein
VGQAEAILMDWEEAVELGSNNGVKRREFEVD